MIEKKSCMLLHAQMNLVAHFKTASARYCFISPKMFSLNRSICKLVKQVHWYFPESASNANVGLMHPQPLPANSGPRSSEASSSAILWGSTFGQVWTGLYLDYPYPWICWKPKAASRLWGPTPSGAWPACWAAQLADTAWPLSDPWNSYEDAWSFNRQPPGLRNLPGLNQKTN